MFYHDRHHPPEMNMQVMGGTNPNEMYRQGPPRGAVPTNQQYQQEYQLPYQPSYICNYEDEDTAYKDSQDRINSKFKEMKDEIDKIQTVPKSVSSKGGVKAENSKGNQITKE